MVSDKGGRKHLPPYISYRTFWHFLEGLQQGIPARIDRSFWGDRFSGSTGNHLMATLRYLGLVDANGVPVDRMKRLASVKGDQRTVILREITFEGYAFLLRGGSFDLQTATFAQLREVFEDTFQSAGDVNRKCIKFFVALAADAGINLSPFITKRFRTGRGAGTTTVTKRTSGKVIRNALVPLRQEGVPHRMSWDETLLTKFPAFDPAWSDEIKISWFKAFDELLKRSMVRGEG